MSYRIMRIWLNKHFGFSKGEFNGLLLLIIIIILLKSFPLVNNYFKPLEKDNPNLVASIKAIQVSDQQRFTYIKDYVESSTEKVPHRLFKFDPNKIDVEDRQTLGLSAKQAQSIVNYRNKGGKFYKAEDLQRMYTVSPEMYKKLLPYIEIEPQEYARKEFQFEKKDYVKKALVVVDVNQADSTALDQIKGIGPTFALRILKYRERLGGFHKKEQLLEVYGLDSAKYAEVKDQIFINPKSLRTININNADFNQLKTSPYLSYKQINAILQYRKQHGNYNSVDDLKKVLILNQQVIDKITPYLTF
ncbi:helix-hairpin-helix domain-containing protein [Pedobacter aquatilis]|uniref:ComEA family DNA-binding protein n=1 Tax=Pedobacter aquatilis TaxID=351343 RepID=UPI0025B61B87|nr:helix-hairpin-helix domain-containing protein [Pedobacter aquatilis]MDN3586369.1 helix-hairpin-helix domain-containing protein [Pedobacter aquatilis]